MDNLNPSPIAVVELTVNLDDATGQLLGDAQEKLLEAGALDVWTVPIGMKKQRPGVMLCALCEPGQRDTLARLILRLTGAMGVRFRAWDRLVLERTHEVARTRLGAVRMKIGRLEGEVVTVAPEYEDVKALAEKMGVAVRVAMLAAQAAADEWVADPRRVGAAPREGER